MGSLGSDRVLSARSPQVFLARVRSAVLFLIPLSLLVVIWSFVVNVFEINPRIFPSVASVWHAGVDSVVDGTLVRHIGASLWRIAVGTTIGLAIGIPLGIAMGVIPAIASFFNPLVRFFSVLAGIAWIPIATLWFGYG